MSKPDLFVNTTQLSRTNSTYREMESGSITPSTFKTRKFETSVDDLWFKDEYEFDGMPIVFFGINEKKVPLIPSLTGAKLLNVDVKLITKRDGGSINSNKYTDTMTGNVQHTSLEKELLLKGLEHLLKNGGSTALVDIFDREASELVLLSTASHVHTHTIVLYKNPTLNNNVRDIVVIDPNNLLFSSHLKHLQNDQLFASLQSQYPFQIKTKHVTLYIYKPSSSSYRDCTDIAVKLALGLDQDKTKDIDLDKISQHPWIKLLTNQTSISKDLITTDSSVRIKQTSSMKTVKAFNDIEETTFKTLKKLREVSPDKYTEMLTRHDQISFDHRLTNKEVLSQLLHLNKDYISEYQTITSANHTALSDGHTTLNGNIAIDKEDYL